MAAINMRFLERLKPSTQAPTKFERFVEAAYKSTPTPSPDLVRIMRAYKDTQKKRS